ncbi:hypothetical protein BHE74_00022738 [Ensete ventricosum]|nr:hypothetical protein BHE74_00022738 [Ensete ventricosum]
MKIDYACQSSESLRRNWNKMLKVTIQHPFKLKTEVHYSINFLNSQRGRMKEEQFIKKVKDMLMVEEKQRIPIAQGLPWTTDEPEVVERINFAEQLRLEREMQRKVFLNDKNSPFCSFYACMSRCVVYLGFFFIVGGRRRNMETQKRACA